MLQAYRDALVDAGTLAEKLSGLAEIRSREGYMAEWRTDGAGFLLSENHCPICAAATACQGFCRSELDVFRAVLGPGVKVTRTDHVLAGARRCAYRIVPFRLPRRRHAMTWINALPLAELATKGKAILRRASRQILLVHTERGLFACANRCPYEGYPLSEGSLADGCVLTCNWHNWKFHLLSGATLVAGDTLPRYATCVEAGRVWVDVAKRLSDSDRAALMGDTVRTVYRWSPSAAR